MQKTAVVDGVQYNVIGEIQAPSGAMVIVLDVPMMSDIDLQRASLLERLRRSDIYATHENVPQAVNRLEKWLDEHDPNASAWYIAHEAEYDIYYKWFQEHDGMKMMGEGEA